LVVLFGHIKDRINVKDPLLCSFTLLDPRVLLRYQDNTQLRKKLATFIAQPLIAHFGEVLFDEWENA